MSARILVVDDEPQIRRVMRVTLGGAGYVVADARSGEEGIQKLREERFDLVLLDVNLPGIGGIETCRQIRARSDVRVMILTVRNSNEDAVAALDAGADDYVTKPFSMDVLLARVRANLRRSAPVTEPGADIVRFGNVEIRVTARRVMVDAKEVRLTPKEFDLLRFLVSNDDVALPHERILQAVWGPDYGNEVQYLRVFIKQLRKKLEPDPGRPQYILTEPWLGYRFRMPQAEPV
ncbi:MAG: response regulator transcription factor [Bryobacteraceae bacterium]|jgi:two-component system KDP operon response regulator KdpE